MKSSRKENFVYAVLLVFIGILTIYGANQIPAKTSLGLGANYLPKIVGYLLEFLAICFAVKGLLTPGEKKESEDDTHAEKKPVDFVPAFRFIMTVGLMLAYVLLLKRVGFIIMTTLYIFAQSLFMVPREKRNIIFSLILGIVSSFLLYFIFSKGLNMLLPPGVLKGIL